MVKEELEKLVLVNLIRNKDFAIKMSPFLNTDYFQSDMAKKIVITLSDYLIEHNQIPSILSFKSLIESNKKINATLTSEIIDFVDQSKNDTLESNIEFLMERAETMAKDVCLYNAMVKCVEMIRSDEQKGFEIMPELISEALSVSFNTKNGIDLFDDFDEFYKYLTLPESRLRFSIPEWNEATNGGVLRKSLNAILAASGVGKTMLMCFLSAMYIQQGYSVLYISLEMNEQEIRKRIFANLFDIEMDNMAPGLDYETTKNKFEFLKKSYNNKLRIYNLPAKKTHAGHIENIMNDLKLKEGIEFDHAMIDYLGISGSYLSTKSTPTHEMLENASIEYRNLATKKNCALWTGIQMNREGYKTDEGNAINIAASIAILNTVDYMCSAYYDRVRNVFNIKQLKSRYSGRHVIETICLGCDYPKQRLFSLGEGTASMIDNKIKSKVKESVIDDDEFEFTF